jgi:hypothetical protein
MDNINPNNPLMGIDQRRELNQHFSRIVFDKSFLSPVKGPQPDNRPLVPSLFNSNESKKDILL